MARELTRDELTPVLIYKGPATAYVENIKQVAMKNGYRLIDSRVLRKSFTNKMKELEAISDQKLMFVEGKDIKLFTPKPKEKKVIPKSREERAIESSESVAKAVEAMTAVAEKIGTNTSNVDESESLKLKQEIEELKKQLGNKPEDDKPKKGRPPKAE